MSNHPRITIDQLARIIFACIWAAAIGGLWSAQFDTPRRVLFLKLIVSYLLFWGPIFVLSNQKQSEIAKRFLLASSSVFLIIPLLEFSSMANFVDFRTVFSTPTGGVQWLNPQNMLDPELIYIRKPYLEIHASAQGGDLTQLYGAKSWKTYRFDVKWDRNGFRNPRNMTSADVICIGDSFIEAGMLQDDDLITSILAARTGCRVANLGVSGYGPQQELAVLRRYGIRFQPKVCLWFFFEGNDLTDMLHYDVFIRKWPRLCSPVRSWWQRSFTRNLVAAVWRLHASARSGNIRRGKAPCGLFRTAGGSIQIWFGPQNEIRHRNDRKPLQMFEMLLRDAHNLCFQKGIRLVVVFIPTKFRVYHRLCDFPDDSPCLRWHVDDLPSRLRIVVTSISQDVLFVDLTSTLTEAAEGGDLVYFPDDTHWTERGHALAAEALTSVVKKSIGRRASRAH